MNSQSPRALTRPRHYAALIVQAAGDIALQRQVFEACPFEMRAQVRELAKLALYKAEQVQEHERLLHKTRLIERVAHKPAQGVGVVKKSDREFGQQCLAQLRSAVGGVA